MKNIARLFLAALLYASATIAHASPVLNKVAGSHFDIYYEPSDYFSAKVDGNSVKLRMNDFYNKQVDILQELRFMAIVAHEGKSIKSAFDQNFTGSFMFGAGGSPQDAAYASLRSALATGSFNGVDFDDAKTVGSADDMAIFSREGNPSQAGFNTASYGDLTGSFYRDRNDDGGLYTQLGLLFDYRISIGTDFDAPGDVSVNLYEMSFTFESVDDPVSVPEPASLALLAMGSIGLCYRRRSARSS